VAIDDDALILCTVILGIMTLDLESLLKKIEYQETNEIVGKNWMGRLLF